MFNKIIKNILGSKSDKDMKMLNPILAEILKAYQGIKDLSNDELREKTIEFRKKIADNIAGEIEQISSIKLQVENDAEMDIDQKEKLYEEVDKLEKICYEKTQDTLNNILPEAFSVMKETAKRFAENETVVVAATQMDRDLAARYDHVNIVDDKAYYDNQWMAGGTLIKWNMVHYDVQLIGGVVLHQGKIAEMATGEGKTLVATLPVYLNALPGKGVHLVTVNDYLAKRDSEWMGMLLMFHGLTVDCVDKHEPNSQARRRGCLILITLKIK